MSPEQNKALSPQNDATFPVEHFLTVLSASMSLKKLPKQPFSTALIFVNGPLRRDSESTCFDTLPAVLASSKTQA